VGVNIDAAEEEGGWGSWVSMEFIIKRSVIMLVRGCQTLQAKKGDGIGTAIVRDFLKGEQI